MCIHTQNFRFIYESIYKLLGNVICSLIIIIFWVRPHGFISQTFTFLHTTTESPTTSNIICSGITFHKKRDMQVITRRFYFTYVYIHTHYLRVIYSTKQNVLGNNIFTKSAMCKLRQQGFTSHSLLSQTVLSNYLREHI